MYGLDPRRISSHSLRIGGATTAIAAAGMSEYEIKQMGGWKSDVFLDYARNTTQLFERARRALAKRTFTIPSTRRLNSGCTNTVSQHFQIGPSNGKYIYLCVLSFNLTVKKTI